MTRVATLGHQQAQVLKCTHTLCAYTRIKWSFASVQTARFHAYPSQGSFAMHFKICIRN